MSNYEKQSPIWMGYSEPKQKPMYKCPYCDVVIEGAELADQHYERQEENFCPACKKLLKMKWEEV